MVRSSLSEGSKEKQKTAMEAKKLFDVNKCGKYSLTASHKAVTKEA